MVGKQLSRRNPLPGPELPEILPEIAKALPGGCYQIAFFPSGAGVKSGWNLCEGTLRVDHNEEGVIASGDLYKGHGKLDGLFSTAKRYRSIPFFSWRSYRYYFSVYDIRINRDNRGRVFHIHLNLYQAFFDGEKTGNRLRWEDRGNYVIRIPGTKGAELPPKEYPWQGDLISLRDKITVGTVHLRWISSYLRRAIVEIDKSVLSRFPEINVALPKDASGSENSEPDRNGPDSWHTIFEAARWEVKIHYSNHDIPARSRGWTYAELHKKMLIYRDVENVDQAWQYYLMCVRSHAGKIGVVFDSIQLSQANNVFREGAVIASHFSFDHDDELADEVSKRYLHESPRAYLQVALHEIGHLMGILGHTSRTNTIMNTLAEISTIPGRQQPFPENLRLVFSRKDQYLLRHLPDIAVRPGTPVIYDRHFADYVPPFDPDGHKSLDLELRSIPPTVPVGAPVRLHLDLVKTVPEPVEVPHSLSLKTGCVRIHVSGPGGGKKQWVHPVMRYWGQSKTRVMTSGQERLTHAYTLFHGSGGYLFPKAGDYTIDVYLEWWNRDGQRQGLKGSTGISVSGSKDSFHDTVAQKIRKEPDLFPLLVLGGDAFPKGEHVLQETLRSAVLRPHFEAVEARRLGESFLERDADFQKARRFLSEDTILSVTEVKRILHLVKSFRNERGAKALFLLLRRKYRSLKKRHPVPERNITFCELDAQFEQLRQHLWE